MPRFKMTEFAASRRFRFNKMKVASNDVRKGKVMSGTHWHSTQQHPPLIRLVQKPRVILPSAPTNFFFQFDNLKSLRSSFGGNFTRKEIRNTAE